MAKGKGRYAGKVIIVTGSSGDLGRDSAVAFAKEGASVTIHGQSPDKLQETKKLLLKAGATEDQIAVVQGSLDDPKTLDALIKNTVDKFGRIDVLVNNAGIAKHPKHDGNSGESFDYVFAINVKAPMLLTEKAAPYLEKTKGNVIVISSGLSLRTSPQNMVYSMSNAARDHFVRNAANLYTPRGIRVNSVNPGVIRTAFRSRHGLSSETDEAIYNAIGSIVPSRRAGEAQEVTNVLLFLASEQAAYVTGASWFVDGGLTAAPVSGTPTQGQVAATNGKSKKC
ncbi:short-chain dehydrogenease/reductase-like protein [Aphelenchoides avenae]|nr:short-chain dehydrogenease/reductase-like protein [Aphelenchus avenae]